jgi:hypothetical protein
MSIKSTELSNLLNSLNSECLVLPEIQREFVWTKPRIVALVDSLFRNFPIGSFLVWKTLHKVETTPKKTKSFNNRLLGTGELIEGYLLDGQQRLTALLKILNEEVPVRFHLVNKVFEIETRRNSKDPLSVSLVDALNNKIQIPSLLQKLQENGVIADEQINEVTKNYLEVTQLLKKQVAIIEYPSDDYSNATKLFIRFNSGGVKLKQSELAIAELARSAPSLVGNEMRDFSVQWRNKGFAFTIPFLARCLAVVKTGSVRLNKPDEIWEGTKNELKDDWKRVRKAIEKTIAFISGSMHWDTTSWLSSYNALIPIIYILSRNKKQKQLSEHERKILRKWLVLVTIRGRYSGSVETKLDSDIKKIKDNYCVSRLWNIFSVSDKKKLKLSEIITASRSGPVMAVYYSMLKHSGAKDWVNGVKIDGTILGHNSSLEVHHIFPKSILYEDKWSADQINIFGNYALLQKGSNIEIANKLPNEYLRTGNKYKIQCIPFDRKLWHIKHYEIFLKTRERLLQTAINKFLGLN